MAEVTQPIFTINDFPNEIIERFVPDNRPRTVSNLRLVNARFRDVFSADHFYRAYLWYSHTLEKYREDLEEIGKKPNRWKLCLEAEKRRLENWRNGRPTRVDRVRTETRSPKFLRWIGKTGENGDLWMLAECIMEHSILVLNVTKAPILIKVDISPYTSKIMNFATLLPDQVIIEENMTSRHVFDIQNDGNELTLEYKFHLESSGSQGLFISGKSTKTQTLRNLFVSYSTLEKYKPNADTVLRVWDLKTAAELESIDLLQLLSPRCAHDFFKTICRLYIKTSEFPHIVVEMWYTRVNHTCKIFAVVNVEEGHVVIHVDSRENINRYLKSVRVSKNTAGLCFFDAEQYQGVIKVYDLKMQPNFKDESGLLYQCTARALPRNFYFEFPILYIQQQNAMVTFVVIDRLEVFQGNINRKVMIGDKYTPVGPFLVNEHIIHIRSYQITKLSTWDAFGTKMFDWDDILLDSDVNGQNCTLDVTSRVDFLGLSKYIVARYPSPEYNHLDLYIFSF